MLHVSTLLSVLPTRGSPPEGHSECQTLSETPGSSLLLGTQRKEAAWGRIPSCRERNSPASRNWTTTGPKKKSVHLHHPAPHCCLTWVSSPPRMLNHLALLQLRKMDRPAGAGRGQHFWTVSLTDSKETAKSHLHSLSSLHQERGIELRNISQFLLLGQAPQP